ncbi:hypothetical protein [Hydrogenimonas sp.]
MYHYLKWAAVGYFFRRNARYLILIVVGAAGIYVSDAVYEDLADFAAKTGRTDAIAGYLLAKWAAVALFLGLILFSIMRLGFERKKERPGRFAAKSSKSSKSVEPGADDPVMRRLEKFRTPERLKKRADLIVEKKRRKR